MTNKNHSPQTKPIVGDGGSTPLSSSNSNRDKTADTSKEIEELKKQREKDFNEIEKEIDDYINYYREKLNPFYNEAKFNGWREFQGILNFIKDREIFLVLESKWLVLIELKQKLKEKIP